ncbi:MAG: HypC/HybG/HupF family hydrogenase formation chaperone [Acidimicrobiales bacterium]
MCLGVPGKITEIREERGTRMATVDFGGVTKDICLAFSPEAGVGEYAIVHAGFAITILDEESALETLAMMREVGLLDDELGISDSMMARVDTSESPS